MTVHPLPPSTPPAARAKSIGLWVLKIVFGLAFLGAAFAKLSGQPMMVAEFDQIGLGQWFRYAAGLIELGGAIAMLVPRTAFYGAALLTLVSVGALAAQLFAIHQDWVHCIVFIAAMGTVAWAHRPRG